MTRTAKMDQFMAAIHNSDKFNVENVAKAVHNALMEHRMNPEIKKLLIESGLQPYYDAQAVQISKFAELLIEKCASICYNSSFADSDAHAQNLLFEFNISGCRDNK